ncbi:ABC transporter ATP-binding protein [Devosia sp. A449]
MVDPQTTRRPGFVRLEGIRKTYGQAVALDDVSLDIAEGEFLTLLGPSGSGKTTCLRAIAGMLSPDSGQLTIAGRDVSSIPMHRRNIGMVFQNYSLFPHLNVGQNVAYPLKVRRVPANEIQQRVERALDLVQLGKFISRRPSELSGGQQQRVALARAIVFEPDVLLLDEPLSALDRILREEMQLELRRIHREIGTTMICVTHDRTEALTMSDRVVVMRNGRIVQDASPREIYLRSGSRFVAEFLGEVNVLPMTVTNAAELADEAGRKITLGNAAPGAPGTPVDLVVRVEHVGIAPAGGAATPWQGKVVDALFLGDCIRMTIACGTHKLVARVPMERASGLEAGMTVDLDLCLQPPMAFAR